VYMSEGLDKVQLFFEDNGLGIDEQYHEKIFASFFRNAQDANGTGLGLYIVKQNVEKLGGRVSVQSKLGQGALFMVELPKI
jgi:signal transduction histidine kinase